MCFGSSCQVPVATGREGCFRICHCDGTARLSNCVNLECVQRKPCTLRDKTKSKFKYSGRTVFLSTYVSHWSHKLCKKPLATCSKNIQPKSGSVTSGNAGKVTWTQKSSLWLVRAHSTCQLQNLANPSCRWILSIVFPTMSPAIVRSLLTSCCSFSADDGEMFMDGCNMCTCFSGELICTKKHCPEPVFSPEYNASKCSLHRDICR